MDNQTATPEPETPISRDPSTPVIGIGASAGGLEALRAFLEPARLPTGMAYVIVQHLDPNHESMLADLLGRQTSLNVRQAEDGETVLPDHVYIIPPGHGLVIRNCKLALEPFVQPRGLRRPIDDFFMSLGDDLGAMSACVILSGTGADGTLGLRAIKEHGGLALVQEPKSARYDGMPLSAVSTGMVDFVLAPENMLDRLRDYFGRAIDDKGSVVGDSEQIDAICRTLRKHVGNDFTGYKHTTLARRIQRRMQVLQLTDAGAYRKRVRDDANEAAALQRDLLINVTRFFRDPEYFEALRESVIVPLVERANPHQEIRVWVPGCSSGEEAYTLAMILNEEALRQNASLRINIFASDIDEQMLEIAREGRYLASSLMDIPEDLRERYTIQYGDHFRISPGVRDMVRFSSHSVIKDPPFSRLSLVCCRNLFIYFGDELQSAVLPIFHYALQPKGFLFLGPSETIGRADDLFTPINHRARIFSRIDSTPRYPIQLPSISDRQLRGRRAETPAQRDQSTTRNLALERMAERYAMPGVVLDRNGNLIESYGRLGRYFEFSAGSNHSASRAARPGLREVLLPLMRQACESRQRMIARDVVVRAEFGRQKINVVADPLADDTVLMVFRDVDGFEAEQDDDLMDLGPANGQVEMLEGELQHTRRQLRDKTEELETANEELKSSNEEMMSMNEELQSTNEELSTVNDELKEKVDQLSVANDDLKNFFESTQLPVVVLDNDLRLRSFTDAALEIFPFQRGDHGRPLNQVTSLLSSDAHLAAAARVIKDNSLERLPMSQSDGSRQWMLIVHPYLVRSGAQEGVTMVFTDITEMTSLQAELDQEREQLELAVQLAGIGIWEYQPELNRAVIDEGQAKLLGMPEAGGHPEALLYDHVIEKDREDLRRSLEECIAEEKEVTVEFRVPRGPHERPRWLRTLARPIVGDGPTRILGVSFDVTADRYLAENRELMIGEMNHRVKNLFAVISAMVSTMSRKATSTKQLADDLRDNISSLGRAHALTNRPDINEGITLEDLLNAILKPFLTQFEIEIRGPEVQLQQADVTPLALILHEWSTNAVKYGALSENAGNLHISWTGSREGGCELTWREVLTSAPDPATNTAGFGSHLLQIAARQLQAELDNALSGNIFQWTLKLSGREES